MKSPPDVRCIPEAQLFIWRPRGILDEDLVNRIVAFLIEREKTFEGPFNRFSDLSLLDAVDLSFKFVFQVALYRRIARLDKEPIKSAFLVTAPAVARYVKLHALMTDHSPLQVEMFGNYEAAAEWLGVSPELLRPSTA